MSYRYPYSPDMNAPSGMPAGYPYGPPPMPTSNPMLPTAPVLTYPPSNPAYPSSMPYPSSSPSPYPPVPPSYPLTSPSFPVSSPYPSASPYPPVPSSYPLTSPSFPASSPYPSSSPSYPGLVADPSNVPYPSSVSPHNFPNSDSPYPTATTTFSSGPYVHARNYPPVNSTDQSYNPSGISDSSRRSFQAHPSHKTMSQFTMCQGTVREFPGFDPQQDAQALRKAMKGFGTDEKAIINILAKRSNAQRVYIGIAFKQLFGKDLIDDLKSELSGKFEDCIIALMTPTNDYLASEVHKAISGIGTDEDILIEVLCTRTNHELWGINESYGRLYGKKLEDDIKGDTSGHFQRLLVSTCTGARSEAPADETRATQKAHELYAAGVGQWGTDESVFNAILVAESFQQLAHTFYEYQKLAGHTVTEAIDKELSGDLKKGMLTIARCVENRPLYFADKLYKAMKGLGTDDRTLIRIVVTRCELDMVQIKAEYERKFGKTLSDAISGDTSGDYRRVLIALVDGF